MDKRSICRVVVVDGDYQSVGTGFLVAPNRVLTAAHVVSAANDDEVAHPGDVELRFLVDGAAPVVVKGKVERFDSALDWAVVGCAGAPAVDPMPLRRMTRGYGYAWRAFGFPVGSEAAGLDFDGHVVAGDRRIQLAAQQTVGRPGGLSGAPLVIGSHVVGIVQRSRQPDGSETLFALDLAALETVCDEVGQRIVRHEPPYVADVQARIGAHPVLLPTAADKLGLAGVDPDSLSREISRKMMGGGVVPTLSALKELARALGRAVAVELLGLAAETWLERQAVEDLWQAVSDPTFTDVILLNTRRSQLGQSYTRRMGCLRSNLPGACWSSALDPERGQPGVVLERFEVALTAALQCDRTDLEEVLGRHDHASEPIVIWVPPPALLPVEVQEIRSAHGGRYRRVNLLLLVGSEVPDQVQKRDFPRGRLITPLLTAAEESAAARTHETAAQDLERFLRRANVA